MCPTNWCQLILWLSSKSVASFWDARSDLLLLLVAWCWSPRDGNGERPSHMLTGRWCALGEVKMIDTGFLPGWIAWIGIGVPDSKYLCGMHNAKDIHLLNFVWIFESFNEEIQPDWSWKSSPHNSCRICRSLVWLGRYTHTIAMRDGGPQESARIPLVREGSSHAREMHSMKTHLRTVGKKPNEVFGTTYRSIGLWVGKWNCMFVSFCYVWVWAPPFTCKCIISKLDGLGGANKSR